MSAVLRHGFANPSPLIPTLRFPPYPMTPLAFPKPPSRKSEKRAARQVRRTQIALIRRKVGQRDRRCRVCGEGFGYGELTPEMHELTSRARLRGRPPEEIFNMTNCVMIHRRCHREVTERRVSLAPVDPAQGANGFLEVRRAEGNP